MNWVCSPPEIRSIRKNRTHGCNLKVPRGRRQRQEGQGADPHPRGKSLALGLVSWFRSSPHYDIDLLANFETKTTLGINTLLVSFRFRNSPKGDIEMLRISESGHWRVLC